MVLLFSYGNLLGTIGKRCLFLGLYPFPRALCSEYSSSPIYPSLLSLIALPPHSSSLTTPLLFFTRRPTSHLRPGRPAITSSRPSFNHTQDCDDRFTEYVNGYNPIGYDPRCRAWYQDASASGRSEAIFTKPYSDAGSGKLTITVAGPVYDSADPTLLLGVAGIDMDITDIENSVNNLAVIGDKGLAYLLAPGTTGEVAVHHDLNSVAGTQYIIDLESGVDEEEYRGILARMSQECIGSETYSNGGDTWLMSWAHETASSVSVGSGGVDCAAGYIVVVTVGESSLLEVSFNSRPSDYSLRAAAILWLYKYSSAMIGFPPTDHWVEAVM